MTEQKKTLGLRLRTWLAKLRPTWFDKHDLIALTGFALFIRGVAMYSHPLAYIAAGIALCFFSYVSARPDATE